MARNATSKNKTQDSYNSTNEPHTTSTNSAYATTTSKNHAGQNAYNTSKNCHTDSYDADEME